MVQLRAGPDALAGLRRPQQVRPAADPAQGGELGPDVQGDAAGRAAVGFAGDHGGRGRGAGPAAAAELRGLSRERLIELILSQQALAERAAALERTIAEQAAEIDVLRHRIAKYERAAFGRSSEKSRGGGDAGDESGGAGGDQSGDDGKKKKKKRKGGRPGRRKNRDGAATGKGLRYSPGTPIVAIPILPPEAEGLSEDQYEVIGRRVCDKLAAVNTRHLILRHEYLTIKIVDPEAKAKQSGGTVFTPPAREGVFKNSCVDVSFIADLLVGKFAWHLPLYRQHQMLAAAGITAGRGSLTGWANRAIGLLGPIRDAMRDSVLAGKVVLMDETPVRAGCNPELGRLDTGYYWPVLGEQGEVVFDFADSRAHSNVPAILGGFEGTLVSDGYAAYSAFAALRRSTILHAGCWSHARRNFEEHRCRHERLVGRALSLIGEIYGIEARIKDAPRPERLLARATESAAAADRFFAWCDEVLADPSLTPKHPIRKAASYAAGRKAELRAFLSDPDVPIDTNEIERALRRIKLGQKNWLFSWTELGAVNVGIVNSLIATCQMQGVDPFTWLVDVLQRIQNHPADRIGELTPRRWKQLFAGNPMTSDAVGAAVPARPPPDV